MVNVSAEGVEINKRFFRAIEILIAGDRMRGLNTFTRAHNINRWNLITVRDSPANSFLKPEWIYFLCKDYNISLDWIFFGTGNFYRA